jgi:tRNA G46 methylase TrmB
VRVDRHRLHSWRQPIAAHSHAAFGQLQPWLRERASMPLVLDSGCGTGASSAALAAAHPDWAVVGVDQSLARLSRHVGMAGDLALLAENAALLRAPLQDIWRLLLADGWRLERHLLWYPNPWPKPEHLGRRWHAHPVFPALLALGGNIELRSNWRIYIDEFAMALNAHGWQSTIAAVGAFDDPVTPFERKYRDSGHPLWCLATAPPANRGE